MLECFAHYVENRMMNDLKWVKWIDEYITLAMNDPFICLPMFYARIKSFILNEPKTAAEIILYVPVLFQFICEHLVIFGRTILINSIRGLFSVGICGILLDYLIFEEYGIIFYAHIFPGNIFTNFRNISRCRSLVGNLSAWSTPHQTTTFKRLTISSKHPQNTSFSRQSK